MLNRQTRFIPFVVYLLGLAFALAAPSTATAAGFIKIAGVEGETRDAAHKGEIELLSYSWGESPAAGNASSTGKKRQHGWITISKPLDKASPKLSEAATNGTVFPSMTLYLPDPEKNARAAYMKYELKDVFITAYSVSGSADGSIPTETLSLNFDKITPAPKTGKNPPKAAAVAVSPKEKD